MIWRLGPFYTWALLSCVTALLIGVARPESVSWWLGAAASLAACAAWYAIVDWRCRRTTR